jgi:hypothetical protein
MGLQIIGYCSFFKAANNFDQMNMRVSQRYWRLIKSYFVLDVPV